MEPVPDLIKGRSRKVWIWAAAALVLIVIAGVLWWAMRRGRRIEARRRVEEAWARFERCLIGPPLAEGESARARVRLIWLATPPPGEGLPAKQREGLWPARCARYLDAAWSDAYESGLGDPVTDVFVKASGEVKGTGEPGRLSSFDDLFAAMARTGVPLGAAARVPFPAEPARPFRRAELASLGSGWVVTWARRDDAGVWRFLLDGKSLCEIDLAAASGGCESIALAGLSDATTELVAGEPGAPPVVIVSAQGNQGVYQLGPSGAKGERPVEKLHGVAARGAWARAAGSVDLIEGDAERGFTLVRIRGGKESERTQLPVARGAALRGVAMIDDSVVWLAGASGPAAGSMRLQRVAIPASGPPAAAESLGELPAAESGQISGCRHGDTRALLVSSWRNPTRFLAVRGKHAWGELHPIEADGPPTLSCRPAGVILFYGRPGSAEPSREDAPSAHRSWKKLHRVRCTNAECATDGVTLDLDDEAVAADIGERGAVAEGQPLHGGRPGGVRLRVAPVEGLHGARGRLLLDDGEDWHDGADPAELYLFGGPEAGLLVVPTLMDHALLAFRVAPDGGVTPVKRR